MAFFLTYIEKKPMRLKGRTQFGAIAVSDGLGALPVGLYRGLRTGEQIEIYTVSGRIFPSTETEIAFALTHPIPVTTDDRIKAVRDPLDEVFVPAGVAAVLDEFRSYGAPMAAEAENHRIPADFFQGRVKIGSGWIKQSENSIDTLMIVVKERKEREVCSVVPVHFPQMAFDIF